MFKVREIEGQKYATQLQNVIDPLEGAGKIDEIVELVEKTLEAMYIKENQLKEGLPVNSTIE